MDFAIKSLKAAKVVSAEIPIPGISTALETTLSILEKCKEIKNTRDDCRRLAERAATLMAQVYEKLKDSSASIETEKHVMTLLQALQDIESFMDRCLKTGKGRFAWLRIFITHGKVAKRVEELAKKLDDAVNVFLVQAAIGTQQKVEVLVCARERVLQHVEDSARVCDSVMQDTRAIRADVSKLAQNGDAIYDGTFRYFARENLELTEVFDPDDQPDTEPDSSEEDTSRSSSASQNMSGRVCRYRAKVRGAGELTGAEVVVHLYPTRDERFAEEVKLLKSTCHPFIVSALGYSRPGDPGEAAFIVLEDHQPVEPHLSTVRGLDNLRTKLKMIMEICSSIDHLENMTFNVDLHHDTRGTHSLTSYAIRADEIMFDCRNGGHFKWVCDPFMPRQACYANWVAWYLSGPPRTWVNRKALVNRLKPVSRPEASAEEVAATWFWLIQTYPWIVNMGRGMCNVRPYSPQNIAQVGEWLALEPGSDAAWSSLVADDQIEIAAGFSTDLSVLGAPATEGSGEAGSRDLTVAPKRTFGALAEYGAQGANCELTHDVRVGGLRWTRYLVQCMPVGTTFVFLQALDPDGTGDVSKTIRAVAAATPSDSRTMGIVTGRQYLFDTTLTHIASPDQAVPAALYFFVLRRDREQGVDHDCSTPWAFWSAEREPADIPEGVTFDATPRFEPLSRKPENPVFAWTQVLGGLTFSIQSTVFHRFTMLTEDEVLALRQLRELGACTPALHEERANVGGRAHIDDAHDGPRRGDVAHDGPRRGDVARSRGKGAGPQFRTVHTRDQRAIQRLLGCLRDVHG